MELILVSGHLAVLHFGGVWHSMGDGCLLMGMKLDP